MGKDTTIATGRSRESYRPIPCRSTLRDFRRKYWPPSGRRREGACCATCRIPGRKPSGIMERSTCGRGILLSIRPADSVFQIAAHEKVVPLEELYEDCRIARKLLTGKHAVGRVIARPFDGRSPQFCPDPNRHDFSLLPPKRTMLVSLQEHGFDTYGVGKIFDIFRRTGNRPYRLDSGKRGRHGENAKADGGKILPDFAL